MPERDGEWERQHLYRLFTDDLGLRDCSMPQEAYNLVRDLLASYLDEDGDHRTREALIGSPGATPLVLIMLENAGLIEHGATVEGAWLTGKGRTSLEMMRHQEWESDDDFNIGEIGYPHDSDDCTAECWTPDAPAQTDIEGAIRALVAAEDAVSAHGSDAECNAAYLTAQTVALEAIANARRELPADSSIKVTLRVREAIEAAGRILPPSACAVAQFLYGIPYGPLASEEFDDNECASVHAEGPADG
jgi:hypothetical protein